MSFYDVTSNFPCQIQPSTSGDGKVFVTLEMDSIDVRPFIAALDSLQNFFRLLNNKAKVAIAYSRQPEIRENASKYYEEYIAAVVDTFKILRRDLDTSTRAIVSATLAEIKKTYPNAYYGGVKEILTKSGLLKEHGFYTEKKITNCKKTSL